MTPHLHVATNSLPTRNTKHARS